MKIKPYTSWSLGPSASSGGRTHIISAWIPESHISFHPKSYGNVAGLHDTAKKYINREDEFIVAPGKFHIMHHTPTQDARIDLGNHGMGADSKINRLAAGGMIQLPKKFR